MSGAPASVTALYNRAILALAVTLARWPFDPDLPFQAERRSPSCGSRVRVGVALDAEGRVDALGLNVEACALGQASAALLADAAMGRGRSEIDEATAALRAFLNGERAEPGEWPGLEQLAPARPYPARHPSMLLAFEALSEAMRTGLADAAERR